MTMDLYRTARKALRSMWDLYGTALSRAERKEIVRAILEDPTAAEELLRRSLHDLSLRLYRLADELERTYLGADQRACKPQPRLQ